MVTIDGVSHIGVRIVDAARSEEFYARLGFQVMWRATGGTDPVMVLKNASGVEINLIVNGETRDAEAPVANAPCCKLP